MMRTILAQHRVLRLLCILTFALVSPLITDGQAQDFNWWQQPAPGANVTAAWQITKGSPEIIIAVLDDHINVGHPDIQPAILSSANCTLPINCWLPIHSSDGIHGTAVTNIISGQHNNYGIDGVCPECRILAVEIAETADQELSYQFGRLLNPITAAQVRAGTVTYQITAGIRYAMANGARVINLSSGLLFAPTAVYAPIALAELDAVLHEALDAGIVIVSAAGNKYETVLPYPAMMERVIGVGGSDLCGQRYTPDSSACVPPSVHRGTYSGSASGYGLDLLAPSVSIKWARSSALYDEFYGTSAAAPIVSGVVGLMLSVNPDLSPAEVQAILRETAVQPAGDNLPGYDEFHGYGLLDAAAAVSRARDYTAGYVEAIQDVGEQVASSGQDAAEQGQELPPLPPRPTEEETVFRDMIYGLGIGMEIDALPGAEYQMMFEAWLRGEL
ncbi:MAG TPA: S8/S53 family peptidase, partial [Aggregatilineales bacterium]|nr:S8/S53 family peptidase [Aggregatilineales bacterium]